MEIKKIICKSGREYNIVNEYWETSRAWGHKSTLVAPWGEVESHKVRYYNRTWERYTYESCMSGLIDTILEDNLKSYITQYKEKNDITRLTSLQKDMIKAEWQEKEYTQELMEIKERINDRRFD
jgi:hypothetical protein